MTFGIKRLLFSGLVIIIVTCLIVGEVTVGPWSEQLCEADNHESQALYSPMPMLEVSLNEPKVNIDVSEFTDPQEIGSEAEIRVTITSRYDVYYVTVRIDLLEIPFLSGPNTTCCIEFIDGNKSRIWLVDFQANVSMVFTERIKAIAVGFGALRASAAWWGMYDAYLGQDGLLVSVS